MYFRASKNRCLFCFCWQIPSQSEKSLETFQAADQDVQFISICYNKENASGEKENTHTIFL